MTKFAFFARNAERWGKDLMSLWGNLNICPHLNYLELPCHTSGELLSISSLKIWGDTQEPCNDMAYLLVCIGSELWHIPNMDKSPSSSGIHNGGSSRDTVCQHLQWTWLALCPCTAIWGLQPYSPSKRQAFRHFAPGKGGVEPLWAD